MLTTLHPNISIALPECPLVRPIISGCTAQFILNLYTHTESHTHTGTRAHTHTYTHTHTHTHTHTSHCRVPLSARRNDALSAPQNAMFTSLPVKHLEGFCVS